MKYQNFNPAIPAHAALDLHEIAALQVTATLAAMREGIAKVEALAAEDAPEALATLAQALPRLARDVVYTDAYIHR